MRNIVLDRRSVHAVLQASSYERTRYAFDEILILNGETREMVATDGNVLIRVKFPAKDHEETWAGKLPGKLLEGDPAGEKAMIPRDLLENAVSGSGKNGTSQDQKFILNTGPNEGGMLSAGIRYVPKRGEFMTASLEMRANQEASFPNHGPIFEKDWDNGAEFAFSVANLEKALKAAKALGAEGLIFALAADEKAWNGGKIGPKTYEGAAKIGFYGEGYQKGETGEVDMLAMPVSK